MTIRNLGFAAAAAAIIAGAPAMAATGPKTVAVEYADLNLASDEGRAQLDARIDRAAREVCGMDTVNTGTRIKSREARECYREARGALDQRFARLLQDKSVTG